jgi:hypothetical protein
MGSDYQVKSSAGAGAVDVEFSGAWRAILDRTLHGAVNLLGRQKHDRSRGHRAG